MILDIGANTDCKPEIFIAICADGSYAQTMLNIDNPVALLNNGEEEGKGNQNLKTYPC